MVQLETLSTAGLLAGRNIEPRTNGTSSTFSPATSDPSNLPTFSGQLTRTTSSSVRIAEVAYSGPQVVRHTRAQYFETRAQIHFLHLQLEGESINRQGHREAHLVAGDITICDNSRPYEVIIEKPNRMLVFGFPDGLMRRYVQCPQSVSAMRIPGSSGMGGLLSEFLGNIWQHCLQDKDFDMNPAITDAILSLVANACRQCAGASVDSNSISAAHRVRIVNYIEDRLSDSQLTPTRIAAAFRITTRYLHHLFSEEKETVARFILRRRLEECARALTSTLQRKRTITAIAFDYGFSSATHFGRVFRSHYDMAPREYRKRHSINA